MEKECNNVGFNLLIHVCSVIFINIRIEYFRLTIIDKFSIH